MCDQQSLRSACAYAQSDQSLCLSLEYSMSVKLLTEHYLEFLSLKGGCTGSSESTLVKMPHCWKSRVAAHMCKTVVHVLTFGMYDSTCTHPRLQYSAVSHIGISQVSPCINICRAPRKRPCVDTSSDAPSKF